MEESAEELESKLLAYQEQLDQVKQLLIVEASNEQFIKLKDDLEQVINLTAALLSQLKEGDALQNPRKKAKVAEPADSNRYSPTAALDNGDDEDDGVGGANISHKPLQVGDHIEVTGGERLFPGVITAIITESEFQVKYYDFETEVVLPLSSLRRIPAGVLRSEDITLGMACQCRYAADQQYYDVTISGLSQFGYRVTYMEYGNSEEVPIEYLRPTLSLKKLDSSHQFQSGAATADHSNNDSSQTQSKYPKKDSGGLIPIPENLKVLPTDTEEEKKRKQKKLKVIKNKNHFIQQEQEVAKVQQSWKSFVNKGTKRPITGITGKQSIFASSEASAAKVGVINSGKAMTNFGDRKKHRFDASGYDINDGSNNEDDED